jgi:hypothetical protein
MLRNLSLPLSSSHVFIPFPDSTITITIILVVIAYLIISLLYIIVVTSLVVLHRRKRHLTIPAILPERNEHFGSTPSVETKENEIYVAVSDVTTEYRVVTLDARSASDTMVRNDAYTGPPDVIINNSAYGIVTGPMNNNTPGPPDVMTNSSAYGIVTGPMTNNSACGITPGPPDVMTNNSAYGVSGSIPNFMTNASAYGGTSSTIAHVMTQNNAYHMNAGPNDDMSAAIHNTENEVYTLV